MSSVSGKGTLAKYQNGAPLEESPEHKVMLTEKENIGQIDYLLAWKWEKIFIGGYSQSRPY